MSKVIILYRHGKSDWGAAYGSDHDRPLAQRGIKSAKIMGKLLAKSNQVPELAITSTALRAKKTLELSILEGNWKCDVIENEKLYFDSNETIFEIIRSVSEEYSSVILVGHEPKWSTLAASMIGGGDVVFKTATMARIDFNVELWNVLTLGRGELRWLHQPSFFNKGEFNL
ncbi:MAG: SixA phosphatase family protein [Thermodesulfobacteriota bacterium]